MSKTILRHIFKITHSHAHTTGNSSILEHCPITLICLEHKIAKENTDYEK